MDKLQCASTDLNMAWNECKLGSNGMERDRTTFRRSNVAQTNVNANPPDMIPSVEIRSNLSGNLATRQQPSRLDNATVSETSPANSLSTSMIVANLLKDLHHRGTGTYHCPYESRCKKGGISADGVLVVFERNSAFRYAYWVPSWIAI